MRSEVDSPYWVATIITTCGQLLLLRYEGCQDDRRSDFWCDIMTADLHPLGWSRHQGKTMRPPEGESLKGLLFLCLFPFFWLGQQRIKFTTRRFIDENLQNEKNNLSLTTFKINVVFLLSFASDMSYYFIFDVLWNRSFLTINHEE